MSTTADGEQVYRVIILGYGGLAYIAFLVTVLYYVGFLANIGVPRGIDQGPTEPLARAVAINTALAAFFGVQHSVMARSAFKDRLTGSVPDAIERSTFVLSSSIALLVVALFWRPIPTVLWDFEGTVGWALWGVFGLGVLVVVMSSFLISHTSLFGLQQVYDFYRGREYSPPSFQTPGFYRYVRHPLMTGILLWFWATPHMTIGHLLFAAAFTVYIVVGTEIEERMLIDLYGDTYREYRQAVPRFFPRPWRSAASVSGDADIGPE